MSCIDRAAGSCDVARCTPLDAASLRADCPRHFTRLIAVAIAAATLAACAQTSLVSQGPATRQQASSNQVAAKQRVAIARKHTPFASRKDPADRKVASHGLASFYSEGSETASGEKFDARELTAAHPTLPFGTKLRVTDVKSGRSVTVRVNDRGPYVPGRVVDVSYSAARALGMVDKGVADVKLDVVQ